MSLLSLGARCSICPLVDFLPFTCPDCTEVFCRDHISSHGCVDAADSAEGSASTSARAVGRLNRGKRSCEVTGCERESIESVAGFEEKGDGAIAKQVRCHGCQGAFCVVHRAQASHSCPAPLDHNQRHEAFLDRRAKARKLIAQQFPGHAERVVPKPPPARDVVRPRPRPLPKTAESDVVRGNAVVKDEKEGGTGDGAAAPSMSASLSRDPSTTITITRSSAPTAKAAPSSSTSGIPASPAAATTAPTNKTKSKAEKLWDLHVRKVRSSAIPLAAGASNGADGARRFFEWIVDLPKDRTRAWKASGRVELGGAKKVERAWVAAETPTGKIMDLIVAKGRIVRPTTEDPTQKLGLLCLYPQLDDNGTRQIRPLILSKSAAEEIVEGSLVVLIQGAWEGVKAAPNAPVVSI